MQAWEQDWNEKLRPICMHLGGLALVNAISLVGEAKKIYKFAPPLETLAVCYYNHRGSNYFDPEY